MTFAILRSLTGKTLCAYCRHTRNVAYEFFTLQNARLAALRLLPCAPERER